MGYIPLGSTLPVTAAADATGQNPGNLTTAFTTAVLNSRVAWYEVFHAAITGVSGLVKANIMIGTRLWGFVQPFGGSEWDPSQPMPLQDGQEVYFLWNIPASSSSPPVTVLWMRYDPGLPGNPAPNVPRLA